MWWSAILCGSKNSLIAAKGRPIKAFGAHRFVCGSSGGTHWRPVLESGKTSYCNVHNTSSLGEQFRKINLFAVRNQFSEKSREPSFCVWLFRIVRIERQRLVLNTAMPHSAIHSDWHCPGCQTARSHAVHRHWQSAKTMPPIWRSPISS